MGQACQQIARPAVSALYPSGIRGQGAHQMGDLKKMAPQIGLELEPFCGREAALFVAGSPQAKS